MMVIVIKKRTILQFVFIIKLLQKGFNDIVMWYYYN